MVKSSVDWIEELTAKELKHLESVRRINVLLGFDEDLRLPRQYNVAEDFLHAIDRMLFGNDNSLRRRIFGMNPWIMKPGYVVYDCFYNGWVSKQPLKREWLDAKRKYDYQRLMQDRKEYYANLED
jgi:hypothetical protein